MTHKISLYIVDDHQMFIDGIIALLKLRSNIEIVGTNTNPINAIAEIKKLNPDILITDINMPEMTGDQLTKALRNTMPALNILCLSMHKDMKYIDKMMNAGANAYLLKNTGVKELFEAIDAILEGEIFYSKAVKDIIVTNYNQSSQLSKPIEPASKKKAIITKREKQIIKLIMDDYSPAEIAEHLKLSYYTVTTHKKNIFTKLGVSKVAELIDYVENTGVELD